MTNKEIELLDKLDNGKITLDNLEDIEMFNRLVLKSGHRKHQAIIFALQQAKNPSSIPFLQKALENGFDIYKYTCSEDATIAKWFSYALYSIGTKEAIQVIKDFSKSENEEIAEEMKYRLAKIK
jgi:hypothetical protein